MEIDQQEWHWLNERFPKEKQNVDVVSSDGKREEVDYRIIDKRQREIQVNSWLPIF